MLKENRHASPNTEPPTAPATATGGSEDCASRNHHGKQYTPVSPEDPNIVASMVHGAVADESRARERAVQLAEAEYDLKLAKLKSQREEVEQETAERRTKSRVKRFLLQVGAMGGACAMLHSIAEWSWEFFHPLSHFELVMGTVTLGVSQAGACASLYLAGRFGKNKSGLGGPKLQDQAAAPSSPGADELTPLPGGS